MPHLALSPRTGGLRRVRPRLAIAVACGLGLALLAPAAHATPPTLGKRTAVREVRMAVKKSFFNADITRGPRCRRATRLRFSCRVRWTDGFRRYRARVAIYRSGLRTSPVDFFRIRAVSGGARGVQRRRHRARGRIVVETRRARLGQTLRLTGSTDDTDIEVTVGPMSDPFAAGELEEPPVGTRYVAFVVSVRNRSSLRYDDSLSNGAKLVTTANTTLATTFVRRCSDTDAVNVPPREVRVGCVVFAVPFGAVMRQVEFRANGGFGRETGVWALR